MWAFAIKQKMTAAILLFAVLGLVMLTNMREQRTTTKINTAVTSIYEDRLVVAQYILNLSKQIEGIITVLEKGESNPGSEIANHLNEINEVTRLYEKTVLTETERNHFESFKALCAVIALKNSKKDYVRAKVSAHDAENILQKLSAIQVEEGKNQLDGVLSMTYLSNIFSYVELAVLIIIALMIQALVLASRTTINVKKPTNETLN